MDKNKVIYWISTGLFSALMLFSAYVYIFNNAMVAEVYIALGYPTNLLYFNATAKILGVLAILMGTFPVLKDWAYKGFVYLLILGIYAHATTDGAFVPALVALILVSISYVYDKKR